jgi:RNA polymerase sigma-70 factor, ECF subfamily
VKKPGAKEQSSDGDLLQRAADGDEEAFLILYERYQAPVFRLALHMSGRRDTAEEVTQEVSLAILEGAGQYITERGSLQAYLIGVARNQVRRHWADTRSFGSIKPTELECDFGSRLVDRLTRDEEVTAVRAAILSLPANYREVVVLCDLEGLDYADVAVELGCPIGTVRSRLHRARTILEAKLRKRERCPV